MKQITVGIDEVGRGSWAGPVVAGAVVLPDKHTIVGLRDSKLMTASQRDAAAHQIKQQAVGIGLGWVDAVEVDANGLSWAVRESGQRALADLDMVFHRVVLDGKWDYFAEEDFESEAIIKADSVVPAVSAGAIIAKVARDAYMALQSYNHPEYGFENHVGYGTKQHQAALIALGTTPLHRRSYKPVAARMMNS